MRTHVLLACGIIHMRVEVAIDKVASAQGQSCFHLSCVSPPVPQARLLPLLCPLLLCPSLTPRHLRDLHTTITVGHMVWLGVAWFGSPYLVQPYTLFAF